jgi:hypothetical protein
MTTADLFYPKFPWWKRKCESMHCRNLTASSFVAKIRVEVFAHFHTVVVKRHSIMRNWLFGLPGRILMSMKIMSILLTLLFTCLGEFGHFVYGSCFLTRTLGWSLPESPSRNRTTPNKGRKNQQFHKHAWNFVHWLPTYANTVMYRCIALLQLLYRRQRQSLKFWKLHRKICNLCWHEYSFNGIDAYCLTYRKRCPCA